MSVKKANKHTDLLQAAALVALILAFGLWKEPTSNSRDTSFAHFLLCISPYVVAATIAAVNLLVSLRRPIHLFRAVFAAVIAVMIAVIALSAFMIL